MDTKTLSIDANAIAIGLESLPSTAWHPSPALVVAVVVTESGGRRTACAQDRYGGSARGLMQIRRPHSRCRARRRDALYDPVTNVVRGVAILSYLHDYELRVHHGAHDLLDHYAGAVWGSHTYSDRVRALAWRISHETKEGWA